MNSPKAQKARVAVTPSEVPEGCYAWFVLLSCFMVFGLTFGVIKAFGVFYVEIHQYFETTATRTSWITSIAVAIIHVGAPIASALSVRFSYRSVVIMGGLICSVGVVIGAFARNLTELYLTVGFLNGFGYALTWTPTVTMLGLYFERRRPVANALASAGECIFTFIITPLFQLLIDNYSWRGAMMILGGLQLNLCVCGMLLRPLKATRDVIHLSEEEGVSLELLKKEDLDQDKQSYSGSKELRISEGADHETITAEEIPNSTMTAQNSNSRTKRAELRTNILRYVDYTLITNARFMIYSMFGLFAALGFFAPALFLVPYARSKGIGEYEAAALMSISAAMDLFGRVFFGWVANLRLVEMVQQLTATVILLGTVLLLCPLTSSFLELAAFSAAYGLAYGATVAIHITVLVEIVGANRLGSALGFFMLIRSSGGLLGPPIAGFFIDKMNDYGTGFLMAGVALIVSALFLLLLHQMNRMVKGSNSKSNTHTDKMEQSC
ncbi:monocarboxylate transporter 3 [Scomber scombrus]|uniref:monocarboxylate transporter 3 n=1 Tax=Scomber scombrus TaxID=13677 RepID=UPI002DD8E659|nr:monocarboxylate transporter 3 [Scomber scombrus]XP_062276800.1 monocarboxylate transporter 3 [Scomber scombrus]XP_062276801.1 monocarboxylate transporter 3 [Scomber scombrus]XP_062276802.1 monocarboxylate transporter 3 [Scomber scombrus]